MADGAYTRRWSTAPGLEDLVEVLARLLKGGLEVAHLLLQIGDVGLDRCTFGGDALLYLVRGREDEPDPGLAFHILVAGADDACGLVAHGGDEAVDLHPPHTLVDLCVGGQAIQLAGGEL